MPSCVSFIYVDVSKVETYEGFIKDFMVYVKEHEPGCLEYRWKKLPLSEEGATTQKYVFFERYTSMEAFEKGHLGSPKFQEGFELLTKGGVLTSMPETTWFPDEDLVGSFTR
ncbi:hypothetical protein B0T25DRAFT_570148 [Lasiosphaeria hispida]|uniref:ABM domain-containing protein n=1 Tax=Lasiosphaeria hispida TaxID=260671 RepID=A0AAJ0MCH8_9PEZI|nr:hypothetical protein B0T25DRAFT_570148 [Lasiosphaeria hispida]